jgi:hypothetical protein
MSMKLLPHWSLVLVLCSMGFVACSSSDDDSSSSKDGNKKANQADPTKKDNGNPEGGGTPLNGQGEGSKPVDCKDAWAKYVQANPNGALEKYQSTSTTTISGNSFDTKSSATMKVLKSSDEAVTTQNTIQIAEGQANTSDSTLTKAEFVDACQKGAPAEGTVPAFETGSEDLTVPAGRFSTKWIRTKSDQNGANSVITIYTATLASGSSLMVKTLSESQFQEGAGSALTTTVLVETNRK